jgi:hypothetical protein
MGRYDFCLNGQHSNNPSSNPTKSVRESTAFYLNKIPKEILKKK